MGLTVLARFAYLTLGLTFAGFGIAGYILPGLPGTVFMILALFCFKRSSPRLENWLLTHPWCGKPLRLWDYNKSITLAAKRFALGGIWIFGGSSAIFVPDPIARAGIVSAMLIGTWYVLSRPTGCYSQIEGRYQHLLVNG